MNFGLSRVKEPKKYDIILIAIVLIMAMTSMLAIYSAFELIVAEAPTTIIIKQMMWYSVGIVGVIIIMYLGNDTLFTFTKVAYWIIFGLLLYLFLDRMIIQRFFGLNTHLPLVTTVNGATSWFKIPGGTFQPSEFMKIVLIMLTACIIDDHNSNKTTDSYESDLQLFKKVLLWAIPPLTLILLQPDTGICMIIVISLSVMLMCSGIKRIWIIAGFGFVGIAVIIFLYLFIFNNSFITSLFGNDSLYKLDRIKGWLDPESDMLGTGNQLYTALMAMGSAGLTGHGMQQNLVNIPEAQTDFIFAVIGQSFGLLGTLFVVGLCLALDLRLIRIATLTKSMKEKYYISGVLGMLLFQQAQNMGMIVGLLPITGITLPFISYGGSSLLSYFLAIGIVMNTSTKAKKLSDYVYE